MNKSLVNFTKSLSVLSNQPSGSLSINGIHTSTKVQKVLNPVSMNANIKEMQYAVKGPIVVKARQIEDELERVSLMLKANLEFYL